MLSISLDIQNAFKRDAMSISRSVFRIIYNDSVIPTITTNNNQALLMAIADVLITVNAHCRYLWKSVLYGFRY